MNKFAARKLETESCASPPAKRSNDPNILVHDTPTCMPKDMGKKNSSVIGLRHGIVSSKGLRIQIKLTTKVQITDQELELFNSLLVTRTATGRRGP